MAAVSLLSFTPRMAPFGGDVLTYRLIHVPALVLSRVGRRRVVKGTQRWRLKLVSVRPYGP